MDNDTYLCINCKNITNHTTVAPNIDVCRNCGFVAFPNPYDPDIKYFVIQGVESNCPKCGSWNVKQIYNDPRIPTTSGKMFTCLNCVKEKSSLTELWICENEECKHESLWEHLVKDCTGVSCPKCGCKNLKGSIRLFKGCPICAKDLKDHYIHRDRKNNYVLSSSSKGDDEACFTIYPNKSELDDVEYFDKKRTVGFVIVDPALSPKHSALIIRGYKQNDLFIIESYNEWSITHDKLVDYLVNLAQHKKYYERKLEIHIDSTSIGMSIKHELESKIYGSSYIIKENNHVTIIDSKFHISEKMNHLDNFDPSVSYTDPERKCIYCGRPAHKDWRCCADQECIAKELQTAKQSHEAGQGS
jgi:hypothetical protein